MNTIAITKEAHTRLINLLMLRHTMNLNINVVDDFDEPLTTIHALLEELEDALTNNLE